MSDRKTNKVDPQKVQVGHLMAFIYWTTVKEIKPSGELVVTGLDEGVGNIQIRGEELVKNSLSADQYEEDASVTKTQAAEILIHSANRPFTVCYDKQDGTERVIRGRLIKPEPLLGRSMVEDLDTKEKNRLRQVDHRTIKWLVVDGIRYIVK